MGKKSNPRNIMNVIPKSARKFFLDHRRSSLRLCCLVALILLIFPHISNMIETDTDASMEIPDFHTWKYPGWIGVFYFLSYSIFLFHEAHTYHTLRLCSPNDWHRLFYPCPNDWTCLDCIERNFSGGSARNFHRLEWFRDQFKDKKKDYITKFQEIAEERVGPPTDKKVIVIITFTGDRTMF